ncbi:MAG: cytochrome c [Thermoleophilaceae bacterium]|nr:cytochrome c [Thermoleophilaceae bacterium]
MIRPLPALRPRSALLALAGSALMAAAVAGCGGEVDVKQEDRVAATIFNQRCSGCHTLTSANSYGSKPVGDVKSGERTNGPNFDQRKEKRDDVLFAIRNGGFSGAIMPANIVVGEEAEMLADFLASYSGTESTSAAP